MRRFFSAIALCVSLLVFGALVMTRPAAADEDVIVSLLELPAPPPYNPLVGYAGTRPPEFFAKSTPPPDDAPIEDLMDYWANQSSSYQRLGHNVFPSRSVTSRLIAELARRPERATEFLNIFNESADGALFIKRLYDRSGAEGSELLDASQREAMQSWLTYNSPYFTENLEKAAARVADSNNYVTNQDDLLSLAKYDWAKAEPIVNRLYNDSSQPVSRVLAMWAQYKHALETDSLGDTDRYRSELMAVVEDRNASDAMRDLAFDALVKERDWSGRDDWYYRLLEDETLSDLRVNGTSYTGLTTLVLYSPPDKYKAKMLEFTKSDNKTLRSAAVRNLMVIERTLDIETTRALLPWLTRPTWVDVPDDEAGRSSVIRALEQHKIPEAVPALISLLDERDDDSPRRYANSANAAANAANTAFNILANSPNTAVAENTGVWTYNAAVNASNRVRNVEPFYPHRYSAIGALTTQADPRAAPPLRRLLAQIKEPTERVRLIGALVASGGFSLGEQVAGLEAAVKIRSELEAVVQKAMQELRDDPDADDPDSAYVVRERAMQMTANMALNTSINEPSMEVQIGMAVLEITEPGEPLIRAVVDRIMRLEKTDPQTAASMRRALIGWRGPAVNAMNLRDLKNGKAPLEVIVRLLTIRKDLREKQMADVYDATAGVGIAQGVTACIIEDTQVMAPLLSGDRDAAAAVLACARLVRGKLPVEQVIPILRSEDKRLALAAEKYLESEDSPEARAAVLSLHPNKAKILGARVSFSGNAPNLGHFEMLRALFEAARTGGSPYGDYSVNDDHPTGAKSLSEEAIADAGLLGIYAYGDNVIRIYGDRVMFAVYEDATRYRERALTSEEFDEIKQFIVDKNVDAMPPFLGCEYSCTEREFTMVGRNGGRRVFMSRPENSMPEMFAWLERYFADLKLARPMRLRYIADKLVPGLEVVFADDAHKVEMVWKNGDDMRLLVEDVAVCERIEAEFQKAYERIESGDEETTADGEPAEVMDWEKLAKLRMQREFEGVDWRSFNGSELGPVTSAPAEIEYPPFTDQLTVTPETERWKATAGTVEIRRDETGLFKLTQGRLTKIAGGNFEGPVISPNGKWVIARTMNEEYEYSLVRINLITGRSFTVNTGDTGVTSPVVYMPSVNGFLLSSPIYNNYDDHEGEWMGEDVTQIRSDLKELRFALLDPETGRVEQVPGEVRPMAQQGARRLQSAGKPDEFWAAMPDLKKDETVIGVYDSRFFNFRPVLTVPKINFDSMDMWVDQTAGKAYFIYKGHLLAAPLYKPATTP